MHDDAVLARLWRKDATLWKKDAGHQKIIRSSLGWLKMPDAMKQHAGEISGFAEEIRKEGFEHVLLLGMGGSSLAPEVFRQTFPAKPGWPRLTVLDSTSPEAVAFADEHCDPRKTLYLVSSKSGTTTEPLRLFDYFWARAKSADADKAGKRFVAVTDPASYLQKLARRRKFRRVFANPADIGGRYSALSYFGLVPAALMGVDVSAILDRARKMQAACGPDADLSSNPGLALGAALGALAKEGRDKITFLVSPGLGGLGLWLEQLLAESTGKEGKGVVPIADEPPCEARRYAKDRVFVHIRLASDDSCDAFPQDLERAGHPVIRIPVADRLELGAEFYRWEIATAVLGRQLGINPFDQPDVQAAKDKTKSLLEALERDGKLPEIQPHVRDGNISLHFSKASAGAAKTPSARESLARFLADIRDGDYIGLLPYLSAWTPAQEDLRTLRRALLDRAGVPVQSGFGPRYLHSTGQLHKGGPDSGVFLLVGLADPLDVKIPGAAYSFGQLITAQALGDFQALDAAGRRACAVSIQGDPQATLRLLADQIADPARPALKA